MIRPFVLAFAIALVPTFALAHACPALMAEIDQALEETMLSDEQLAEVEALRAEGEELHEAGDHDASMAALEAALEILGQPDN